MEILPPPDPRDDPLFAVRVALGVTLAFPLAELLRVPVPSLTPVLLLVLLAGQRGAFNPRKVFTGAVAIPVIAWLAARLAGLTRGDPAVFIAAFALVAACGFYLLVVVANPAGTLLLIFPSLLSAMALVSDQALVDTRNSLILTGLSAGVVVPLLYLVFPPRTRELHVPPPARARPQRPLAEIAIRMAVFIPTLVPFYYGADPTSIVYLVIVVFVLGHPEHVLRRREALERVVATCLGGAAALVLLAVLTLQPHFPVLLLLVLIFGLWFSHHMMTGPFSPMTYQFGYSVMVMLVALGIAGQDPFEQAIQRVVLTLAGATAALLLLALLEDVFLARSSGATHPRPPAGMTPGKT